MSSLRFSFITFELLRNTVDLRLEERRAILHGHQIGVRSTLRLGQRCGKALTFVEAHKVKFIQLFQLSRKLLVIVDACRVKLFPFLNHASGML